ncbi:hypothetical protein HR10_01315 [Porphyromonas gulae]|uniref:Lipoprotein n=2 Tax=Porphyromonas gulae TaxID=111105 RepID=A0A0A2FTK6_9PORP|nr:hypothetical protein HR15_01600 [Porphyromonas gulae]KKC51840.1 hypothetical protein HR10_01315 [Porphyromonas gulae]
MKSCTILVSLFCLVGCMHAQVKTKNQKEMEQEKAKIEALIKEKRTRVKTYAEKPAYYLQVNKTGCRLLIRVNDIPLGYHFVKDRGQSMLYPINDVLLGSGRHTVSIEVYPRTGEALVAKDAVVNIKVVHYREKLVGMPETIEELDTPENIGTLKTPLYRDTLSFDASLPFDFKHILARAKDLRKVPHLEEKVLAHYNKVRQMMIDGQYYEYEKMRLPSTWPLTEMSYLSEEGLRKAHIDEDYLFRFLCNPIDWIALPIENYEMVICGNGKLVYLRRKMELDNVLRTEYYETEEEKKAYPDERSYVSSQFIALYMPADGEELVELY